ncbi:MAG: hypothetical protein Q9208_007888 [Pyrenodesmia sp. 3 TL-2023]
MSSSHVEPWRDLYRNVADDLHHDLAKEPWIRVYREIYNYVITHHRVTADEFTPARARFAEAKAKYPFMNGIEFENYIRYWADVADKAIKKRLASIPSYTASQLWRTLYDNPLTNDNETNKLGRFLNRSCFPKVIDIGKLDGRYPMRLVPGTGLLEPEADLFDDLDDWANDLATAVKYADGHPSEGNIRLDPEDEDDVLRRFWEVGWIYLAWSPGAWFKTGHVLVMDVEPGKNRALWLILAKAWETDEDEPRTHMPPTRVAKNDCSALGILPGNSLNRTIIAKLIPIGQFSGQHKLILSQLGPAFEFRLQRYGNENPIDERLKNGPPLAHVMT